MATVTPTTRTSVLEGYDGEGPKYRLEHASSGQAMCQQAACKRAKIKIGKGELRVGTHTLFDRDEERRWYMTWRHWGCGTKFQIKGLKEISENDPAKAPGYHRLSPKAQEQVRLAFENENVVDKEFKGVRVDLAKGARRYDGEFLNATGYKVDVATRGTAGCRNANCPGDVKIAKGELRLGICVPFDGERESWVYKHWKCMSAFDLEAIQEYNQQESFDIPVTLSDELHKVVLDTLETGEVVEPPKLPEVAPKPKKSRAKKQKVADEDSEEEAPKPKPKRKGKKRASEEMDTASEPEYVPKKTRSRAAPMEDIIDPAVARIQAMAEGLRTEAAK